MSCWTSFVLADIAQLGPAGVVDPRKRPPPGDVASALIYIYIDAPSRPADPHRAHADDLFRARDARSLLNARFTTRCPVRGNVYTEGALLWEVTWA